MFKKYEEHTVVAYKTAKMTAHDSMTTVMDVVEGGYFHDPIRIELQSDGVFEISFKCTKKEFKDIERILYSLRRNKAIGLGVMTLV